VGWFHIDTPVKFFRSLTREKESLPSKIFLGIVNFSTKKHRKKNLPSEKGFFNRWLWGILLSLIFSFGLLHHYSVVHPHLLQDYNFQFFPHSVRSANILISSWKPNFSNARVRIKFKLCPFSDATVAFYWVKLLRIFLLKFNSEWEKFKICYQSAISIWTSSFSI